MALEPTKHVNGRMWPPGVSGNPNGRPVGSRNVFSHGFLKDLASVWAERGRAAIERTAIDQPGIFFATCARLIGPAITTSAHAKASGFPSCFPEEVRTFFEEPQLRHHEPVAPPRLDSAA